MRYATMLYIYAPLINFRKINVYRPRPVPIMLLYMAMKSQYELNYITEPLQMRAMYSDGSALLLYTNKLVALQMR